MRLFLKTAALTLGLLVIATTRAQEPAPMPAEDKDPPEVEEFLKRIPPDATPEQREQAIKHIRQYVEQLKQQGGKLPEGFPMGGFPPMGGAPRGFHPAFARLGAEVTAPPDVLIEHLDLPRGQGLVLSRVSTGSAAAKAGLKTHDILLEVDGKPVARDIKSFGDALAKVKEDTPVSVVVLRKGKNETIKGLELPKAQAFPMGPGGGFPMGPPDGFPPMGGFPMPPGGGFPPMGGNPFQPPGVFPMGGGEAAVISTVFRFGDRVTARYQEGSLTITLTGEKDKVNEISVQDGRESGKYENLDKVPAAYRDKARALVEMIEKSNAKIEIKPKEKESPKPKEPIKEKE